MDTSQLPDVVNEYLADERTELFEFTERLVGFDTQNPPGGTQTAHGTDEYTTTEALARNVTAYARLPVEYDRQVGQAN